MYKNNYSAYKSVTQTLSALGWRSLANRYTAYHVEENRLLSCSYMYIGPVIF